ncbi:uncharacterized protein IL334_003615 [Kwoniella shivajii]|uniref:Uncharacterized protein n=1 Tax=Kwoniella shivajii TaxID=564305 RepID=A0ABZ1CY25_9TREE|nr:hypothetical protein IL334_003615 [Kwoniella shivajii]
MTNSLFSVQKFGIGRNGEVYHITGDITLPSAIGYTPTSSPHVHNPSSTIAGSSAISHPITMTSQVGPDDSGRIYTTADYDPSKRVLRRLSITACPTNPLAPCDSQAMKQTASISQELNRSLVNDTRWMSDIVKSTSNSTEALRAKERRAWETLGNTSTGVILHQVDNEQFQKITGCRIPPLKEDSAAVADRIVGHESDGDSVTPSSGASEGETSEEEFSQLLNDISCRPRHLKSKARLDKACTRFVAAMGHLNCWTKVDIGEEGTYGMVGDPSSLFD